MVVVIGQIVVVVKVVRVTVPSGEVGELVFETEGLMFETLDEALELSVEEKLFIVKGLDVVEELVTTEVLEGFFVVEELTSTEELGFVVVEELTSMEELGFVVVVDVVVGFIIVEELDLETEATEEVDFWQPPGFMQLVIVTVDVVKLVITLTDEPWVIVDVTGHIVVVV